MSAADRLAALDQLGPAELCQQTETALSALVTVMNAETTLLRAHRYKQAGELTAEKTQLAQDYVTLARAVQRRLADVREQAPGDIQRLHRGHESLATQIAENLRVIATARHVTEKLLGDVASTVGAQARTRTYGANGAIAAPKTAQGGLAINRAL